jgi:hypothetical protein
VSGEDFAARWIFVLMASAGGGITHEHLLVNMNLHGENVEVTCQLCAGDADELDKVEKVHFPVQLKINPPLCVSVAMYLLSKRMKTKKRNLALCASPGA